MGALMVSRIFLRPAVDESDVGFLHFALGELLGEFAVGVVIFGDYDEAAGFFVEAMDDAGRRSPPTADRVEK